MRSDPVVPDVCARPLPRRSGVLSKRVASRASRSRQTRRLQRAASAATTSSYAPARVTRRRTRVGPSLLAMAVLLVAAACASAPEGTDTTTSPTTTSSDPTFSLTVQDSAFFLDLRTGTQTPLPSTSGENDDDELFDDGHLLRRRPRRLDGLLGKRLLLGLRRGRGGQERRLPSAEARPDRPHQLLRRRMVARRHEDRLPAT